LIGSFDGSKYCTRRGKYQTGYLKKALDETCGLGSRIPGFEGSRKIGMEPAL
jgi:hypothetical protein